METESPAPSEIKRGNIVRWFSILIIIAIGAAVRIKSPLSTFLTPDEFIYTNQAKDFIEMGFSSGFQQRLDRYIELPEDRIYPIPTRLGATIPIMTVMKVSGDRSAKSGIYISLTCSILTFALITIFIFRTFELTPTICIKGFFL